MFAPRIKWGSLKTFVESIREIATVYEGAYNRLSVSVKNGESFEQV